jgi:hypothetical protein
MRGLIRRFDAFLRRREGVYESSACSHGLLRLRLSCARERVPLGDGWVEPGEQVLELHLWNEHMPPLPREGPSLAWAWRTERKFVASLRDLAREMRTEPAYCNVRALRAVTVLLTPGPGSAGPLAARLGFVVRPYHNRLGRFGEFWENFYTWFIMWTFNAASLRGRRLLGLRRLEMWMTAEDFVQRFGG